MKLNQKGAAGLVLAVVIMFFMGVIITAAMLMTKADTKITAVDKNKLVFFNAADAGAEYMYALISSNAMIGNSISTIDLGNGRSFSVENIRKTSRFAAGYSIDIGGSSKPFIFVDYSFTSVGTYAGKTDRIEAQITFGPVPAGTGY